MQDDYIILSIYDSRLLRGLPVLKLCCCCIRESFRRRPESCCPRRIRAAERKHCDTLSCCLFVRLLNRFNFIVVAKRMIKDTVIIIKTIRSIGLINKLHDFFLFFLRRRRDFIFFGAVFRIRKTENIFRVSFNSLDSSACPGISCDRFKRI